ncbi:MAG: phosphatase PAP2 family protein [Bacteroidetes bacterium]|nr:phosphatase PAP2 family protein [Bacteroidota bacterium]
MTSRRGVPSSFVLLPTDVLILGALLLFSLITVIFSKRVTSWEILLIKNIFALVGYITLVYTSQKAPSRFFNFFLRVAAVTLAYAYLFGAVGPLQLIIHDRWLDENIIEFEQKIFGVQPTVWLEQFIAKPLTEWMMFSYVIYIPLYPILCGIIYYMQGKAAMEDYFFTLGLTNILCDIGFIVYPVASPLYHIPHLYRVHLEGWLWTYLGEFIRAHFHFPGGSIPSPHAAAATIMWVMAYRYHKVSFWILTPIILSLYIATFYCRFHYVTDAVVGIVTAVVALLLAPYLYKIMGTTEFMRQSMETSTKGGE